VSSFPQASIYGSGTGVFPWPPKLRDPLPPPPVPAWDRNGQIVWSRLAYRTQLPPWAGNPPDVRIYRGGFCNDRVPGLQWLPGMGGQDNQGPGGPICMDLDIFRYRDAESHRKIFQAHQDRGYTHFQFSLGDADRRGWTPGEVAALCRRWKSEFGGYCDIWFLGGGRDGDDGWKWCARDQFWPYWQALTAPWIEALTGCFDAWCVGWQLEGFNSPESLFTVIAGFCAIPELAQSAVRGYHNLFDAGAWWSDNTPYHNRFEFWAYQEAHGLLNRLHYQVNTESPRNAPSFTEPGGTQPGLHDVLRAMRGNLRVDIFEDCAQDQFDDPLARPEWSGDMRGRIDIASIGDNDTDPSQIVAGYGNGCRDFSGIGI